MIHKKVKYSDITFESEMFDKVILIGIKNNQNFKRKK